MEEQIKKIIREMLHGFKWRFMLPNPYYQDKYCTIYHADCRDILPILPKVDLVLG